MKLIESYVIAILGGGLFYFCNAPIPWILGPMTCMIVYKWISHREMVVSKPLYNSGLMVLGIYFGLFFTAATFVTVYPYILPFLGIMILILTISVVNSIFVTKFVQVDPVTSVFGSIPGGLSEMVAASESLKANSGMVTIFQTVRLLTVVFLIPLFITQVFSPTSSAQTVVTSASSNIPVFGYLWFGLPIITGIILRNKLPAAYVIGPLAVTALLGVMGIHLPNIPIWVLVIAQITVGMRMGNNINFRDLKLGGKYCGVYFILTLILIAISFGFGYLFSLITDISFPTAMLSLAPGGIVEMVLTANSVGADPDIVSSLQLIRLLFIILIVPSFLKWMFIKKNIGTQGKIHHQASL